MTTKAKRDLAADLALCEAATPGPWTVKYNDFLYDATGDMITELLGDGVNDSFIAEAREGWPHAIRRAIAAEAELDAEEQRRVFFEDVADGLSYENARIRASIDKLRQAYERDDSDEALAIAVSAFLREVSEDATETDD